jgi:penicillin-binding protein 1C
LIGNILSDGFARRFEFGRGNMMEFPVQTAIKTGTSNDYRDAWVFAYNYKYLVGVWMGNLDNQSTEGLTGSGAPMFVARALMAKVTEHEQTKPLLLSSALTAKPYCVVANQLVPPDGNCPRQIDYFMPGTFVNAIEGVAHERAVFRIKRPTQNLQMAIDPRAPLASQAFVFEVEHSAPTVPIKWTLDSRVIAESTGSTMTWPLLRGRHVLTVTQSIDGKIQRSSRQFVVK